MWRSPLSLATRSFHLPHPAARTAGGELSSLATPKGTFLKAVDQTVPFRYGADAAVVLKDSRDAGAIIIGIRLASEYLHGVKFARVNSVSGGPKKLELLQEAN